MFLLVATIIRWIDQTEFLTVSDGQCPVVVQTTESADHHDLFLSHESQLAV